jgi:LytS/YehU family sensor histidine kinase
LRDEVKLVDSYIYILNVRFSGGIRFHKEIDENVLDIRVPSMILQPVVENAVNYGIRDIEYVGEIHMSVRQEGENIDIVIEDNGAGMEQSTIDRIMTARLEDREALKLRAVTKDSNGIGLGNVINRLRLYYDRDGIFSIESTGRYQGTKVTIHVPILPAHDLDRQNQNSADGTTDVTDCWNETERSGTGCTK